MLLCKSCIEEIRSRGELVYVGEQKYDCDESEEMEIACEWCDEHDDLYDCKTDEPW